MYTYTQYSYIYLHIRIFEMSYGSWNIRYRTVFKTCRFCGFWSFLSIFEPVFGCFWIRKCFATDPDYGLSFWLQFLLKNAQPVQSLLTSDLIWNGIKLEIDKFHELSNFQHNNRINFQTKPLFSSLLWKQQRS